MPYYRWRNLLNVIAVLFKRSAAELTPGERLLAISWLCVWNHLYDSTFPCEHIFTVPPDDQGCNNNQHVCVVGLRVRKDGVYEREMEERR